MGNDIVHDIPSRTFHAYLKGWYMYAWDSISDTILYDDTQNIPLPCKNINWHDLSLIGSFGISDKLRMGVFRFHIMGLFSTAMQHSKRTIDNP